MMKKTYRTIKQQPKEHYKLYKAGKTWSAMLIVVGAVGLGEIGQQTVHATASNDAVKVTETRKDTQKTPGATTSQMAKELTAELKATKTIKSVAIGLVGDKVTDDAAAKLGAKTDDLKANGFVIKSVTKDGQTALVIQGKDDTGLFYAMNEYNKRLAAKQDVSNLDIHESPQMSIRGVIEGFYGQPWSDKARKDMFAFMGENRMNTYIYSPKDDVYLRNNWRDPYPQEKLNEIKSLVEEARKHHVEFVYTLSPGNDITYSSTADYEATLKKLDQMRQIGVKQFYIALDDIAPYLNDADKKVYQNHSTPNYPNNPWSALADAQSEYLNNIQNDFVKGNNLPDLWLVPTNYSGSSQDPFKEAQGQKLDKNIRMQWTGEGVFSADITADSIIKAKKTYNVDHMFIWDNFPVNDSDQDRLYLNPVVGRANDLHTVTDGFTSNPMIQPYASWIGIASFGDYMWNADTYKPQDTLARTVKQMAGADANIQKTLDAFVDLNQYWNYGNAQETVKAPALAALIKDYQKATVGTSAHTVARANLRAQLDLIAKAPETLKTMAVTGFYDDAKPWITAAANWAKASLTAISINDTLQSTSPDLKLSGKLLTQMEASVDEAMQKALPDSRTGKPDLVITPSVGDGEFEKFIDATYQQIWNSLEMSQIIADATALKGTASTTIPQYENNVPANMTDGDLNTKFWSSANVKKGQQIVLKLDQISDVQRVTFLQGPNNNVTSGDILTKATVYAATKADGSDRVAIGKLSANGFNQFDLDKPVKAQYITVEADADSAGWLQVREFSAYSTTGLTLSDVASPDGKSTQNIFDASVKTSYTAKTTTTNKAGVIEQLLPTTVAGKQAITVVGNRLAGQVLVREAGKWVALGTLNPDDRITQLALNGKAIDGVRLVLDGSDKVYDVQTIAFSKFLGKQDGSGPVTPEPTPPTGGDTSKPDGDTNKPGGDTNKPETPDNQNKVNKITISGTATINGSAATVYDANFKATQRTLKPGSSWKAFAIVTDAKGNVYYHLGGAQYIRANTATFQAKGTAAQNTNIILPMKGVGTVKYTPGYGIQVWGKDFKTPVKNADGTKKKLGHNTKWKVFGVTTHNGNVYYHLGGNQYADARYMSIK